MSIKSISKLLREVNLLKTIYFNFHYFPVRTAIHLPIFIYKRSELYQIKGKIMIDAPLRMGMVKLGEHGLGTQDLLYSRTMWDVFGTLVIKGHVSIGRGTKISIGREAVLTLGDNFVITGNSEIICQKEITFGSDCLLSWDILMMDTDFHHIYDKSNNLINTPKAISIGNHVWIGCKNTILKGVSIADDNIISANSTITRSVNETNCIISGHGKSIEVLKKDIRWEL